MSKHRPSKEFAPPPHANAEGHELVMARVDAMSREEFVESLVQAGICSPDGELTEHYREPSKSKPKGTKAA